MVARQFGADRVPRQVVGAARLGTPRRPSLEVGRRPGHLGGTDGSARPHLVFDDHVDARLADALRERIVKATSVISASLDERVFRMAPWRFRKELIIPVLMDLEGVTIGSARQILTIGTAGAEAAAALNIAASAPVAEVRRVFCAPDGTVIDLGELTHRGDFIRVDMDLLG